MEGSIETLSAVALGIALSAGSGFRVFIPLLVAGLASHFGWIPLGENFAWMGSVPALIAFGVAAVVEVGAYYIPFIDNLLDTIAVPLSVMAGTLLMSSVFPADSEWIKWIMGFVVGGGAAATIQSGTANPVLSTTEGVTATGISVLSLFIPIIIGVLVVVCIMVVLYLLIKKSPRFFKPVRK